MHLLPTSLVSLTVLVVLTTSFSQRNFAQYVKEPNQTAANIESIAVLPWYFEKGTNGAKKTAKEFLSTLLNKIQVDALSEVKTTSGWKQLNDTDFVPSEKLASPAEMVRLGTLLNVDWVMSESAVWHSRSIWVGLGPKTKSTCTISIRIVDVNKQVVALEVKDLKVDDTAKEDTLKALGTVFVSVLFTVVSGGPKTPHEQRAVQIAIAKAMEPWLAVHLTNKPILDVPPKKSK